MTECTIICTYSFAKIHTCYIGRFSFIYNIQKNKYIKELWWNTRHTDKGTGITISGYYIHPFQGHKQNRQKVNNEYRQLDRVNNESDSVIQWGNATVTMIMEMCQLESEIWNRFVDLAIWVTTLTTNVFFVFYFYGWALQGIVFTLAKSFSLWWQ